MCSCVCVFLWACVFILPPPTDLFCCTQGWKITLVGSRFTHAAKSRYAPIEGEALAVADALDKARHFVLGYKNLTIAVDHRPLIKIFGDRSLDHICNTRLRNLKEKTLRYHFKMVHIPGVKNRASDTLSRHPTGNSQPPKMVLHEDIHTIQDSTTILSPRIYILPHGWCMHRRPAIRHLSGKPTPGVPHFHLTLHTYSQLGTSSGCDLIRR